MMVNCLTDVTEIILGWLLSAGTGNPDRSFGCQSSTYLDWQRDRKNISIFDQIGNYLTASSL